MFFSMRTAAEWQDKDVVYLGDSANVGATFAYYTTFTFPPGSVKILARLSCTSKPRQTNVKSDVLNNAGGRSRPQFVCYPQQQGR